MYAEDGSAADRRPDRRLVQPSRDQRRLPVAALQRKRHRLQRDPRGDERSYTLSVADGTARPEGASHRHRQRCTRPSSSRRSPTTSISLPAAIADPIPNPDGGRADSPGAVAGAAMPTSARRSSATSAAGRTRPRTSCAAGCAATPTAAACTYIQQVASTDPETGPTYVVRARATSATRCACASRQTSTTTSTRTGSTTTPAVGGGGHAAVGGRHVPAGPAAAGRWRPGWRSGRWWWS